MTLSSGILWVDEIMTGSTIRRYMLRRWDENISLSISGVDGKTTRTLYSMGRWEYDRMKVSIQIWKGELTYISAPIWKKKLIFSSVPIWKGVWDKLGIIQKISGSIIIINLETAWRLRRQPQILNQKGAPKEWRTEKGHWWVTPWEGTIPPNLLSLASVIEVSGWLILLKLLCLNKWATIDPTGQFWSTCSLVVAASLWSHGEFKKTAILQGRKRRYGKLALFISI